MRTAILVVVSALVALAGSASSDSVNANRRLSFEQRVAAQAAIDRVYFSHRKGTKKSFEEAVPREVLENEVRNYLAQSAALERLWNRPVTGEMLREEMERMARSTGLPDRLGELFAALQNDVFLVQECLARPLLVDRLARRHFAYDEEFHAKARQEAELLREDLLSRVIDRRAKHPSRTLSDVRVASADEDSSEPQHPGELGDGIDRVVLDPVGFAEFRAGLAAQGAIGALEEKHDAFVFRVVLDEKPTSLRLATYSVRKRSWDDWWAEVSARFDGPSVGAWASVEARLPVPTLRHARKPGGSEEGTRSDGRCPEWAPIATVSLDEDPYGAFWTGSEMIVWEIWPWAGGGRYDPATDSWQLISTIGAPGSGSGVWADELGEMIIALGDGIFRYDPATDRWTSSEVPGRPPTYYRPVWTGTEMITWGGDDPEAEDVTKTGGRYDPATEAWTPTTIVGAPVERSGHTLVWAPELGEMIVWGGDDGAGYVRSGSRYDPATDSWSGTATSGAPPARSNHKAVWTGSEMIVWGGSLVSGSAVVAGGRYDPATNGWLAINESEAPTFRRGHTAVWTGHEMIVWGGVSLLAYHGTGGRYDPATDSWIPTETVGAPAPRAHHAAVWTGSEMIVWGGRLDPSTPTNSGGAYWPGINEDHDGDGLSVCDGDCDDTDERIGGTATASVRFAPRTLNKKSQGGFITATIELGPSPDAADIDPNRAIDLSIAGSAPVSALSRELTGNKLTVRFSRREAQDAAPLGEAVDFTVTGWFVHGCDFEGVDRVRVIDEDTDGN